MNDHDLNCNCPGGRERRFMEIKKKMDPQSRKVIEYFESINLVSPDMYGVDLMTDPVQQLIDSHRRQREIRQNTNDDLMAIRGKFESTLFFVPWRLRARLWGRLVK